MPWTRLMGAPATRVGDVEEPFPPGVHLRTQHDGQAGRPVGELDHGEFQLGGLHGHELVADGLQGQRVQLAGNGDPALGDRPQGREAARAGIEAVARSGPRLTEERVLRDAGVHPTTAHRSEEHTSELQSRQYLVCRLLLDKKKKLTAPAYRAVSTRRRS